MNPRVLFVALGVAGLAALAYKPATPTVAPAAPPAVVKPVTPKVDPDCPDGKCPPRRRPWGAAPFAPVGASHEWRRFGLSREYALLEAGRQVGAYDAEVGVYREIRGDEWGPKTWLPEGVPTPEPSTQGGPVGPAGIEVQCEVPLDLRMRNIGSKVDGSGMCVTTTTEVGAEWAGLKGYTGYRNWAAQFPGGSYPPKQLAQLAQYAQEKGLGTPPWAQYVGRDPAPFLDAVLGSGRVACVSWMHGGHWLNLVHLDSQNACIMDNNGDPQNLKWMTRSAAIREINSPYAWVGCWLPPGPPAPPKNPGVQQAATGEATQEVRAPRQMPAWSYCVAQGVFLDRRVGADELTIRGKSGTIDQLRAELGTGTEPRLTVIGTPEQSAAVLAALGTLASQVRAATYPPDSWQVKGMGFAPGSPAVYLQAADGTVLFRQDGTDVSTGMMEAIRKANPLYKPDLDPTPASPAGDGTDGLALAAAGVVAAGVAVAARRKKS